MIKYDVDFFIDFFTAIPEDRWCTLWFTDGDKHCAAGHVIFFKNYPNNTESYKIFEVLYNLFDSNGMYQNITGISDGIDINYQQSTPKQRILAALRNIKNKQITEEQINNALKSAPIEMAMI